MNSNTNYFENREVYDEERNRATKRIGLFSLIGNVALAIVKLFAGYASKSSAMIADGFNSAGDCASSVAMLIGNRIADQPRDEDHPYGHGNAEYIFSAVIGIAMLVVSWNTISGSIESLRNPTPLEHVTLVLTICALNILLKLWLYRYAVNNGKKFRNPMVIAVAQDHKSDVLVTIGTAIGIISSSIGYSQIDGLVGIIISITIAYNAFMILKESYIVLMDTRAKAQTPVVEKAKKIVNSIKEIDHLDTVIATPVGSRFLIVIKISVPGEMTVLKSHAIAKQIENALMQDVDVADVLVHVNPLEEHEGPSDL